ncbi:MAG: Peptidase family [Hyphomicrobiales bacterium]|nr:Peptidase family [Hyphomicrobiales bacterium]
MDSRSIPGRYFPYRSGHCVETTVVFQDGGIRIAALDDALVSVVAITPALANVPRKLTLSDGGTFETSSPNTVEASQRFGRERLERAPETPWLISLLCLAIIGSLLYWGVPFAAGVAAGYTPPSVLKSVESSALIAARRVLQPTRVPEPRRAHIRAVLAGLLPHANLAGLKTDLVFAQWSGGPNAFAFPAGTIVITDAMVQLMQSDDEIAGVLAHEIAHVELRHAAKAVFSEMSVFVLLSSFFGGDQLMAVAASQAGLLQELAYSRADETEADTRAVAIMRAARRDPAALAVGLGRLDALSRGQQAPRVLTTHPGAAERRARILEQARSP